MQIFQFHNLIEIIHVVSKIMKFFDAFLIISAERAHPENPFISHQWICDSGNNPLAEPSINNIRCLIEIK